MGDLGQDTAIKIRDDGHYEASLSGDWEIWGPMGGYVAACALRAGGADIEHLRPAAFSCHYLGVAQFGPIDLRVETRRGGRTATSRRIEVTQDDRVILDGMLWSVGETEGLEHDETVAPDVPGPDELANISDLLPADAERPFPFWTNFDARPIGFEAEWPPSGPRPATWQEWLRFLPTARFEDPWVDAARCLILVDVASWPGPRAPRLAPASVHGAHPRPSRRIPPAAHGPGMAPLRRRRSTFDRGFVRLDCAGLVTSCRASRNRWRAMSLPAPRTGMSYPWLRSWYESQLPRLSDQAASAIPHFAILLE
jgi:acyl-CoA thioesterase-2